MVRIYPVLVVKNTKLEQEYENGTYEPLSVVQAVEICKELVRIFDEKNINVIRASGTGNRRDGIRSNRFKRCRRIDIKKQKPRD